ncbi:TonB-dependent receptor [Komagataeibacter sucrofermentans]|nr:TonB-dependent receptor [Komagataeibacter sucrofermentans]
MTTVLSGLSLHQSRAATVGRAVKPVGKVVAGHTMHAAQPARPRDTGPVRSHANESLAVSAHRTVRGAHMLVSKKIMEAAPPGTNPMAALNTMAGVNFQSADAQGVSTYSSQFFMHGFQQQEIGMTLDGMPLGEMSYRNYNGLNPVLAVSSENVQGIDVSQSAGAESVAATNNLGGSLAYTSSDPKHKLGGSINQGFGSFDTFHTYARVDSGDLNKTGTRFYASYMRNDQQRWKGYGEQFYQQVNAKLVQPIGQSSSVSAYFDWSDLHELEYQDMSPDIIDHLGPNSDDFYNGRASGYLTAYNAALATQTKGKSGGYPAGYNKLSDPTDASYYEGATNENDIIGYLKADLALTNSVRWTTTAYGHGESQQTTFTTPYVGSPNGSPLSELVKQPSIRRFGVISQVTYDVAHNHIGGGVWYENNDYQSPMYQYAEPNVVNGVIQGSPLNPLGHFKNPFAEIFNQNYNTNTFTAFVQDTYRPIRNLALHFGFKSVLNTTRVGDGYLNQSYYGNIGNITSGESQTVAKPFLPHIGVDWTFLKHHELFIDISENVHTYAQSGFKLSNSPFAVTQDAYNNSRNSIRPETAWTYAIGYRYHDKLLNASVYAYRTNFNNRLQQISSGPAVNPVSSVSNVGGVTMNGVDAALTITPLRNLAITNSISYNHAVYDNNMTDSDGTHLTRGQQVVNYPRFMYKARLAYDWRALSFYIDGNYVGQRNYSYDGDYRVPGYWLSNLGLQWHVKKTTDTGPRLGGFLRGLTLSFNLTNLTNTRYIATMGENGNPMTGSSAYTDQSMLIGTPRMAFGAIKADF